MRVRVCECARVCLRVCLRIFVVFLLYLGISVVFECVISRKPARGIISVRVSVCACVSSLCLCLCENNFYTSSTRVYEVRKRTLFCMWKRSITERPMTRGGGLGSRPKKMYGESLGDGVEYHLMSPTPRR